MNINESEFIISAVTSNQYPKDNKMEFAFVGRSNVGKSSLINSLTNRRKLVKVSGTPGKTRTINFFLINKSFYFVDLPGYGYAKVSKAEKENWGKYIDIYLNNRKQLKIIMLLVDSRHRPTQDDINMYKWIKHYNYGILVIATKVDKLTKNELKNNLKVIRDTFKMTEDEKIICFSTLAKCGREETLEIISNCLESNNLQSGDTVKDVQ